MSNFMNKSSLFKLLKNLINPITPMLIFLKTTCILIWGEYLLKPCFSLRECLYLLFFGVKFIYLYC